MVHCKIVNCETKKGERTCFNVPLEPVLRAKWRSQIEKHQEFDETPTMYPVCCLHFDPSTIIQRGKQTTLVKGSVPTIFPGADGVDVIHTYNGSSEVVSTLELPIVPNTAANSHETESRPLELPSNSLTLPAVQTTPNLVLKQVNVAHEQNENQTPNHTKNETDVGRPRPTITISVEDYNRLLKQEIQGTKYKEWWQAKQNEVKRLQDQLSYYKGLVLKLRNNRQRKSQKTKSNSIHST